MFASLYKESNKKYLNDVGLNQIIVLFGHCNLKETWFPSELHSLQKKRCNFLLFHLYVVNIIFFLFCYLYMRRTCVCMNVNLKITRQEKKSLQGIHCANITYERKKNYCVSTCTV